MLIVKAIEMSVRIWIILAGIALVGSVILLGLATAAGIWWYGASWIVQHTRNGDAMPWGILQIAILIFACCFIFFIAWVVIRIFLTREKMNGNRD